MQKLHDYFTIFLLFYTCTFPWKIRFKKGLYKIVLVHFKHDLSHTLSHTHKREQKMYDSSLRAHSLKIPYFFFFYCLLEGGCFHLSISPFNSLSSQLCCKSSSNLQADISFVVLCAMSTTDIPDACIIFKYSRRNRLFL